MEGRQGITYAEIAQRYGRDVTTVRNTWAKDADWPEPVGRRGQLLEFDPETVDAVVRAKWVRVPPEGDDEDLMTMHEIARWLGVSYGAVRSMASRGDLGEPVNPGERPMLYRRGDVRTKRATMRKRGGA